MIHLQMTRDAPEIHPIHVQPDRLLANFERIALFLWNGRIFSLAIPTPIAQATCLCLPVFPLFRVSTAVGTCAHVPYFTPPLSSRHSPLDTLLISLNVACCSKSGVVERRYVALR